MSYRMASMISAVAALFSVAHGASLVKNVGNVPGSVSSVPGIGQKLDDEFSFLTDEFDVATVVVPLPSFASSEKVLASATPEQASKDTYFWVKVLFNSMTFAVLLRAAHRYGSEGLKPRFGSKSEAQAAPAPSKKSPDALVVNFGALLRAAQSGDRQQWLAQLHIAAPAGVAERRDACGCTALHVAAHCGCAEMVQLLLQQGADATAKEAWEETPLHFAARTGSVEVCKLLLKFGADIDAINLHNQTPVLVAAVAGMEDACELLLAHGGGAGGIMDAEIPPMLTMLLFQRMLSPSPATTEPPQHSIESPQVDNEIF
jgi:hypothetical protein